MLAFIADENFDNDIIRGLLRREPDLDIVRIQDCGLMEADDPTILAWAAQENRIMLTHDVSTVTHFAYERVRAGQRMPGVVEVDADVAMGKIIIAADHGTLSRWGGAARGRVVGRK